MLNKIINIGSNPGFKSQGGTTSFSAKNLFKENSAPDNSDKIELSPALKFLKKLDWNLKEVKASDEKYFITFEYRNFEINAVFNLYELNSNPYVSYKIKSFPTSDPEDRNSTYDLPKLTIDLNLSIRFFRKQAGFLNIISGKDSSPENYLDPHFLNSIHQLRSLFEKLFLIYTGNVNRKSETINDLLERSVKELEGLTRINDLLILFLEKLTGEKIYQKISQIQEKEDEELILVNALDIYTPKTQNDLH